MEIEFELVWDELGEPEMCVSDGFGLLSGFFAMEIRKKKTVSSWLVEVSQKVLDGHQNYELVTGESYTALHHEGWADISSDVSPVVPNPLRIPLQAFLMIAQRWDVFIQDGPRTK